VLDPCGLEHFAARSRSEEPDAFTFTSPYISGNRSHFLALAAGSPLLAYPVSVTISVTFSSKLKNGATSGVITTILDSATGKEPHDIYPAHSSRGNSKRFELASAAERRSPTRHSNNKYQRTLTADFKDVNSGGTTVDSFTATLVTGLAQSTPSVYSFGSTNISTSSTATYSLYLLGGGTVGVSGTITAVG